MSTTLHPRFADLARRPARHLLVGLGGLLAFCLLATVVHLRLLAAIDLAATRAKQPLVNPWLDSFGEVLAIAVSAELCVLYATIVAVLLWRAGVGRWSLAPFAFVLLEPVELVLKIIVHQPPIPHEFYRGVYYPLTTLVLQGTFPSGHALRTAFFCAFLVVLLRATRPRLATPGLLAAVLFAALCGFSRIYLGYHWLSDVVAGLVLGASLALVVAQPVVERLSGLPTSE